jgi:hypothetical protein
LPKWLLPFRAFETQALRMLPRLSRWIFLHNHGFDGKSRKITSPPRLRWLDLMSSSCCGEWWRIYPNITKKFCCSSSSLRKRYLRTFWDPYI